MPIISPNAAAASINTLITPRSCGGSTSRSPICLERIGGFEQARVAPVIPSPRPYGYRNRIMIRSQWNKPEQKLNIGFVRWDCGLVEDIEECKIVEPVLNEEIRRVRAHPPPKGGIKIVLRVSPENWDVPPDSFFQNNLSLLPRLVETVRGFLATAVPGIWWICIAASVFSASNLRMRLNRSSAWNTTSAPFNRRNATRPREKSATAGSSPRRWRRFCRK